MVLNKAAHLRPRACGGFWTKREHLQPLIVPNTFAILIGKGISIGIHSSFQMDTLSGMHLATGGDIGYQATCVPEP